MGVGVDVAVDDDVGAAVAVDVEVEVEVARATAVFVSTGADFGATVGFGEGLAAWDVGAVAGFDDTGERVGFGYTLGVVSGRDVGPRVGVTDFFDGLTVGDVEAAGVAVDALGVGLGVANATPVPAMIVASVATITTNGRQMAPFGSLGDMRPPFGCDRVFNSPSGAENKQLDRWTTE